MPEKCEGCGSELVDGVAYSDDGDALICAGCIEGLDDALNFYDEEEEY
jgi:hypothetical protein